MRAQQAVEIALGASHADECIVIAEESGAAHLRWAGNTLTTNGVSASRRLTVIAVRRRADGVAAGVVSRTGVADDQIAEIVAAAEHAAEQGGVSEDAGPLVTADLAGSGGNWDDEPAQTAFTVFGGFAERLGTAFEAAASAGTKLYGYARHEVTSVFLGTSTGLRLRVDEPAGKAELNAKSHDGARSVWVGVGTEDFTDVDPSAMADGLARRLAWGDRRVDLPAGRYETLLPPSCVADLLFYLYASAGALDAAEGRSVFGANGNGTRIGERLASLPVTLRSDPARPGMTSAPFVIAPVSGRETSVFDNGLALAPTDWLHDGELTALVGTRHTERVTGVPASPWIGNLTLEPPADHAGGLDEMIAGTERGLLLTSLWYVREVDPTSLLLTGLTRDGVYLIEHGEVTAEVNNFRFNESPVGMLSRLAESGPTRPTLAREFGEYFTRTTMPPLRITDFNMSSVSRAT